MCKSRTIYPAVRNDLLGTYKRKTIRSETTRLVSAKFDCSFSTLSGCFKHFHKLTHWGDPALATHTSLLLRKPWGLLHLQDLSCCWLLQAFPNTLRVLLSQTQNSQEQCWRECGQWDTGLEEVREGRTQELLLGHWLNSSPRP